MQKGASKGDGIRIADPNEQLTLWERIEPTWTAFIEAVTSGNFQEVIRDPVCLAIAGSFVMLALLKKWRTPLVIFLAGIGMWGIADFALSGGSSENQVGIIVAGAVVATAILVYFVFIKD